MKACTLCKCTITGAPVARGGLWFCSGLCAARWMSAGLPLVIYPVPSVAALLGGVHVHR